MVMIDYWMKVLVFSVNYWRVIGQIAMERLMVVIVRIELIEVHRLWNRLLSLHLHLVIPFVLHRHREWMEWPVIVDWMAVDYVIWRHEHWNRSRIGMEE